MDEFMSKFDTIDLTLSIVSTKFEKLQALLIRAGLEPDVTEAVEMVDRAYRAMIFPIQIELRQNTLNPETRSQIKARLALSEALKNKKIDRYLTGGTA